MWWPAPPPHRRIWTSVLLAGPPAPYRESLHHNGIPVELFVHTGDSLALYRAKDRTRRQATLAALVAESVVLLDRDGSGRQLRSDCAAEIAAGPDPLLDNDIDAQCYLITGLLDDLTGSTDPDTSALLVGYLWDTATRLLLGIEGRWQGSGKGLLRALRERNQSLAEASAPNPTAPNPTAPHPTAPEPSASDSSASDSSASDPAGDLGSRRSTSMHIAAADPTALVALVDGVLNRCGGRLFDGYRVGG
ncbi:MAG: hypothetical protein ACR2P2_06800 [Nakamurella sp.]